MEDRMKEARLNKQKVEKVVNRDIVEMVTKGTYQPTNTGFEPKYILAYTKHSNHIGVTFFDVTTAKIHIGEFSEDDESM
jgi:DNA mismatch repair ATPase MutS